MCWSLSALSGGSTRCLFASGACCALTGCTLVRGRRLRRYNSRSLELTGLRSGSHRWLSVVHRSILAAILSGLIPVLYLCRRRRSVLRVRISFFLCCRSPVHAARPVKAGASRRVVVIDHRLGVNVVNHRDIHVIHRAIIEEVTAFPASPFIPIADISKTVINSTVETDLGAPVTAIPRVHSVVPAPITRRPQEAGSRCLYPSARHPIIIAIIVAPSPIARRPYISIIWTYRLYVNRQRGRRHSDRYS